MEAILRGVSEISSNDKTRAALPVCADAKGNREVETELKKAWEEAYSLRGTETDLTYIGMITRSGRDFLFYRDREGNYWYDSKPEGKPKPEWMTRRRR